MILAICLVFYVLPILVRWACIRYIDKKFGSESLEPVSRFGLSFLSFLPFVNWCVPYFFFVTFLKYRILNKNFKKSFENNLNK